MDDVVVLDEQGDYFPPPKALAAFLEDVGGSHEYDGVLVEVSAYLPEFGFFECITTAPVYIDGELTHNLAEVLFMPAREMRPINKGTQAYIKAVSEVAVTIYDMEVYDIRDLLSLIDINVKAESIAKWDGKQRGLVERYAAAVVAKANDHRGVKIPPKPKELP